MYITRTTLHGKQYYNTDGNWYRFPANARYFDNMAQVDRAMSQIRKDMSGVAMDHLFVKVERA